jgi:hypothetical protein
MSALGLNTTLTFQATGVLWILAESWAAIFANING